MGQGCLRAEGLGEIKKNNYYIIDEAQTAEYHFRFKSIVIIYNVERSGLKANDFDRQMTRGLKKGRQPK